VTVYPYSACCSSEIFQVKPTFLQKFQIDGKTSLLTGRLIVGRDAPSQANSQRDLYVSGGQSSNLDGRM
jgi:hypothetical protein